MTRCICLTSLLLVTCSAVLNAQPATTTDTSSIIVVEAPSSTSETLELAAPLEKAPGLVVPPVRGEWITSGTLRLMRAMEARHAQVKTVHAQFKQVRFDDLFNEKIESPGELWFDKPSRFRCDYALPEPMINLIIDLQFFAYTPRLEQVDYWVFDSIEQRDQQLHSLLIAFGFKTDELIRLYKIRSSEDDPGLAAELKTMNYDPASHAYVAVVPRDDFLDDTAPFVELKFVLDKSTMLPVRLAYTDPSSNRVEVELQKIENDVPLAPDTFNPSKLIPSDVEIIDRKLTP